MGGAPIEGTEVYRRACTLADEVWRAVMKWPHFAKNGLGDQLTRSVDSIAANLVEGDARGSDRDTVRFFIIARASAREARHWLKVAERRSLFQAYEQIAELTEVVKMINGLVAHRRSRIVKESLATYDDPQDDLSPFLTPNP